MKILGFAAGRDMPLEGHHEPVMIPDAPVSVHKEIQEPNAVGVQLSIDNQSAVRTPVTQVRVDSREDEARKRAQIKLYRPNFESKMPPSRGARQPRRFWHGLLSENHAVQRGGGVGNKPVYHFCRLMYSGNVSCF
jgi:hypothetical protein